MSTATSLTVPSFLLFAAPPQTNPITSTGDWDGFYKTVEWVTRSPVEAPSKCPLQFEFTMTTAEQNSSLLEEVNYDLGAFTKFHQGLTSGYDGSRRRSEQDHRLPGLAHWHT